MSKVTYFFLEEHLEEQNESHGKEEAENIGHLPLKGVQNELGLKFIEKSRNLVKLHACGRRICG